MGKHANPDPAGDPEKPEPETDDDISEEVPGPSDFERIHGYPIDEEE